uniref:Uncharacterized protein n=1 Tax=Taeniopygia guttata TaxID=59729 RepID=A0A674HP64_TAEGU
MQGWATFSFASYTGIDLGKLYCCRRQGCASQGQTPAPPSSSRGAPGANIPESQAQLQHLLLPPASPACCSSRGLPATGTAQALPGRTSDVQRGWRCFYKNLKQFAAFS